MVILRSEPHNSFYARYIKRALDIAFGVAILPVVAVEHLVVAPLIRSEDAGPAMYDSIRVGKDGRYFVMHKYRSMRVNAPDIKEADGSTYNAPDDPRQTRIGAFLRKTSLDEVPQVINIIKGDMSFVGPRPDLPEEVALYRGEEHLKLLVRPGLTGYAQTHGRNAIAWHDRLALDIYYVKNISFMLDLRIFLRTFIVALLQRDVFESPVGKRLIADSDHADNAQKCQPITEAIKQNATQDFNVLKCQPKPEDISERASHDFNALKCLTEGTVA
ncbi:MAG: sugar transferase [Coriobacteriales bacterium]|jgi:lipopolysaccharide/colanic/teichoic acid biosynthesis glycosyltransferase|nr:sugar transferase [Coriobacteriales bacterium]